MTRTADGYHLWSTSFDRPANDLHTALEDVAAAVGHRLQLKTPAASAHRYQPAPQAYAAYLQGRYLFDQAAPKS